MPTWLKKVDEFVEDKVQTMEVDEVVEDKVQTIDVNQKRPKKKRQTAW
jgi:hypothetical protein